MGRPDKTEFPKEYAAAGYNFESSTIAHNLSAPYELVKQELPFDGYNCIYMGLKKYPSLGQWIRAINEHPNILLSMNTVLTEQGTIHPNVTFDWIKENADEIVVKFGEYFVKLYRLVRSATMANDIAWLDALAVRHNIGIICTKQKFMEISMYGKIFYDDAQNQLLIDDMRIFNQLLNTNKFTSKTMDWALATTHLGVSALCTNYNITLDIVNSLIAYNAKLSWPELSCNPALAMSDIFSLSEEKVDWETVFMNPSLTPDDINDLIGNIGKPNFEYLRRNLMRNDDYYTTFLPRKDAMKKSCAVNAHKYVCSECDHIM